MSCWLWRYLIMGNFEEQSGNNMPIGAPQPIGASKPIGAPQNIGAPTNIAVNSPPVSDGSSPKSRLGVTQNMNIPSQQPVMNNYSTPPKEKKSMLIAMLLAFLFGPFGMIYTNVKHALILIVLLVVIAAITGGLGGFLFWIVSMIWTYIDVKKFNEE